MLSIPDPFTLIMYYRMLTLLYNYKVQDYTATTVHLLAIGLCYYIFYLVFFFPVKKQNQS